MLCAHAALYPPQRFVTSVAKMRIPHSYLQAILRKQIHQCEKGFEHEEERSRKISVVAILR